MTEPTAWLSEEEQRTWRALMGVAMRLPPAVDAHLKPLAGLTNFDYFILANLSEAPDQSLLLRHLAASVNCTLSRLSHAVSRLEGRGLVCRQADAEDARSTAAVLTEDGRRLIESVAPAHVDHVRRTVFDHLDPAQVRALGNICTTLHDHLQA